MEVPQLNALIKARMDSLKKRSAEEEAARKMNKMFKK